MRCVHWPLHARASSLEPRWRSSLLGGQVLRRSCRFTRFALSRISCAEILWSLSLRYADTYGLRYDLLVLLTEPWPVLSPDCAVYADYCSCTCASCRRYPSESIANWRIASLGVYLDTPLRSLSAGVISLVQPVFEWCITPKADNARSLD